MTLPTSHPPSKYKYGWRGPTGQPQFLPADPKGITPRKEVDPRKRMPLTFDQLRLGSCTANATSACFQYDSILDGKDCGVLSRLWIYYFERWIEGTVNQGDVGAYGHDAFKVAKHGIPDESLWPYEESTFNVHPGDIEPRAYTLTKDVREVPQTADAILSVLSNDQTIAFGFNVYESFEDESWWHALIPKMPVPGKGERLLGGHEIDAVGFLPKHPEYVIARNSWNLIYSLFGSASNLRPEEIKAGAGGYFMFPLKLLTDRSMVSDLRTIVRPL